MKTIFWDCQRITSFDGLENEKTNIIIRTAENRFAKKTFKIIALKLVLSRQLSSSFFYKRGSELSFDLFNFLSFSLIGSFRLLIVPQYDKKTGRKGISFNWVSNCGYEYEGINKLEQWWVSFVTLRGHNVKKCQCFILKNIFCVFVPTSPPIFVLTWGDRISRQILQIDMSGRLSVG